MDNYNDIPKYKKKKKQSSLSSKRSDHKHDYERVINGCYLLTYVWMERCKICGRFQSVPFYQSKEDLLKTVYDDKLKREVMKPLTLEEVHEKFPDVRVFTRAKDENGKIDFSVEDYVEIEFDDNSN